MRIAVTGGSGRIGRAVIALALKQGHSVVSVDQVSPSEEARQGDVTVIQANISDYDALKDAFAGCDGLVHLAAFPSPMNHPAHVVHNNNVVGSYNALTAAVENGIERICQASSINATGALFSRWPKYDYFPLDEQHPTYNEDPYSLSKWICEIQADSLARRYDQLTIASLRFHGVIPERRVFNDPEDYNGFLTKHLWGYTRLDAAARACLAPLLTASYRGHEVFYIVANDTALDYPSLELQQRYFPEVPVRGDLSGNRSFYDCSKAERLLGWKHDV